MTNHTTTEHHEELALLVTIVGGVVTYAVVWARSRLQPKKAPTKKETDR